LSQKGRKRSEHYDLLRTAIWPDGWTAAREKNGGLQPPGTKAPSF